MDNKQKTRGIKRPRSEQIEALAKQNNPIPNSSNHDPAPFLPTTAKTEAAPMIQALKCMSSEEESRFEAFRRCTLPIDAVRKVLVASLAEGIVRRSCMNHNEMIGNHSSSCNGKLSGKKYVGGVQILPKVVRDAIAKPENVKDWNNYLNQNFG